MGFSWKKALSFVAPVVAIVAPEVIPFIGSSILGGAAAAEGVGAAIGLTASQVSSAVGSAALAAGSTAAAGGSVEDVFTAAASAGAASGINFAAGGGVTGAVAGSVAGTAIKGGDESQIVTNAFAAGVGAGVQGAMTNNPDAGKIIGSAARTYISSGGNIDQTLLNTAATAIGTLDKPSTSTVYSKTTTAQPATGSAPFKYGNDTYQELDDGTAKVTTQSGNVRIIGADTFNEIKEDYLKDVASTVPAVPSDVNLEKQTIAETTSPAVSPVVTDLDLIKKVSAGTSGNTAPSIVSVEQPSSANQFPTPTISPKQEDASNVVTDVTTGQTSDPVDLGKQTISYVVDPFVDIAPPADLGTQYINYPVDPFVDIAPPSEDADLGTVTVREKGGLPPDTEPPALEPEQKPEPEPSKEAEQDKTFYPIVTNVRKKPSARQPIISASPARALADVLAAYRPPAGAIEGVESGKEREPVWNTESLRNALGI